MNSIKNKVFLPTMKPFRSRSYNLSNKRERNCFTNAAERSGHSAEESSKSTSVGCLGQSSSDTSLRVSDGRPQEASTRAALLVPKEFDDQGEEIKDTFLNSDTSSETVLRNSSEDSESDYEERMSDKGCEDGSTNTMAPTEKLMIEIQGDLENQQGLPGSESEGADKKESTSEDNSNNVSTTNVKKSLDLDQLEQGNSYTERQIYETQIVQLQRQLVETMIREEEASEKLKKLENLNLDVLLQQLKEEKAKTSELEDKLEFMKNKAKNSQLRRSNASRGIKRRSRNLETVVNQKESALGEAEGTMKGANQQETPAFGVGPPVNEDDDDDELVFNFNEGHFAELPGSTKEEEQTVISSRFSFLQEYKKMLLETIVDRVWDFVNEDPEGSKKKDDVDDSDALSVTTLKENINRCKSEAQPITRFIQSVIDVLTWASPVTSFMTLVVYMFAVIQGFLLPLIILMAIFQLALNYFYASGVANRLGFKWKEESSPSDDKNGLTDRFQLVLQVAKNVQNALGEVADSLEKIKNLLNWQHSATNKLFSMLCIAFVASSILDGPMIFRIVGIGAGIKFFIIRPIYIKFPKVKKRYDDLARLWKELPTDADLAKQKEKASYFIAAVEDKEDAQVSLKSPKNAMSWNNFCVRMKIPLTENPMPSWEEGHRCTLMTRDKPLTKMKQGKLFLTQNFLCFERYKFGSSKHVVIKLEDIVDAEKYQPINFMPGTGTSMKIEIRGSYKPYIFGALVKRDELFESLIATCKAAKVPLVREGKY